ncbi:MAG: hypothetical protein JWO60_219 [Frankiales bacterium]|nr:hypothetical protein [Frankiales bacterium]
MKIRAALLAAALTTPALAVTATPAQAYVPLCEQGRTTYSILTSVRSAQVTHVADVQLAPGSVYSQTRSISVSKVVTAGAEVYGEATAEAGAVLAKAQVKAGVKLQASGSHTRTSAYSRTWSLGRNNTSGNQRYALFGGTTQYAGQYQAKTCVNPRTGAYRTRTGTWHSWTVFADGTAKCGARTGATALQLAALRRIGC